MEDFDKAKNKIKTYHSPLDIENEWKALVSKKENIQLKNKLKIRDVLIPILAILLLTSLSYLIITKSTPSQTNQAQYENNNISSTIESKKKKETTALNKITNSILKENILVPDKANSDFLEKNIVAKASAERDEIPKLNSLRHLESGNNTKAKNKRIHKSKNNSNEYLIDDNTKSNQNEVALLNTTTSQISSNNIDTASSFDIKKIEDKVNLLPMKSILGLKIQSFDTLELAQIKYLQRGFEDNKQLRKNYLLFELFGQGGFYSFNYGRIINTQKKGETDIRIGISLNPMKINGNETGLFPLLIPMSINQSFKIKNKHNISLGTGLTFVNDKIENESNYFYLLGHLKLQYKYQPLGKRVFYKAEILSTHAFENIFTNTNRFNVFESSVWGGVGIGYTF